VSNRKQFVSDAVIDVDNLQKFRKTERTYWCSNGIN
jgi:hypothetical protein